MKKEDITIAESITGRKHKAAIIKAETADEERTCEYCGGELKVIPIGDESYDKCVDCGHYNY